ncbi:hypothetical protein PVAP13_5KG694800 [Panicum virgatum]|uniref:Trigger factor ribosome-binding bacterial domain-containing protein n=2 Tax=Panicum virgatum TaxID=38727 RepID=A0A8T0T2F4_PANVG|nr:hypothetical protein PVAP13_5KG694800 [Panicum virgatum]
MPQLLSGPALALSLVKVIDPVRARINVCGACKGRIPARGLLVSSGGTGLRHTFHPVSAVGSGRDSSITEAERKSDLSLENVKTSIVSRDDEMINVRVQLPGKATQKIFDEALTFLARDAPPVPGFRKSKGGKTSNVSACKPQFFLYPAASSCRCSAKAGSPSSSFRRYSPSPSKNLSRRKTSR